jgi:hypothetical protein
LLGSWSFLHLRLLVTHVLSSGAGPGYPSGALAFTTVCSELTHYKLTNNGLQYTTQKIKDRATQNSLQTDKQRLVITLFVFVVLSFCDVWILFTSLVSSNSLSFFLVSNIENETNYLKNESEFFFNENQDMFSVLGTK